jgi:hypothetical protein
MLGTCLLRLQRSRALAPKQGKNQASNSKEDKNPAVWGTYQKDEKKKAESFFFFDLGQPIWLMTRSPDRIDYRIGFQNYAYNINVKK